MEHAQHSPELLLEHAEFVRALARKLVFDDGAAQDVAQETWLSALQHPPRTGKPVRAWLSKVARNHVLQMRRASLRRVAREQANARDAGVPSTADIVEREAARRSVVDAVVALHEPYRSTILLRYYEDLPPREVARRLGVPVETVRTRLKRGHAMLREQLDGDYGNDRDAWCKALLPFALARPSRVGPGALGIALLIAVAASVAIASRLAGSRRAEAATFAGSSAAAMGSRAAAELAGGGDARTEVETPAVAIVAGEPSPRITTARGRVVDERGEPLHGARVTGFASLTPLVREGEDIEPIAEVASGADGAFELALPAGPFYLHASTEERAAAAGFASSIEAQVELDGIVLQLAPSFAVRGRVIDERGSALAGALVQATTLDRRGPGRSAGREGTSYRALLAHSTRTAGDGSFELHDLPPVKHFIGASLAGYTAAAAATTVARDDLELVLEPDLGGTTESAARTARRIDVARDAVLRGRVIDSLTREPVTHFMVTVRSPADRERRQHRAFDSPDGTFVYEELAASSSVIAVRSDGYAPWSSKPRRPDLDTSALDVELAPLRDLDVRVIDARGEPVQHARLVCTGEQGNPIVTMIGDGYWNDTVVLAPDGTAHLAGLPAATIHIEVRVPELVRCDPFAFDLRTPLEGRQELRLDSDLSSPRRALDLELRTAEGRPVGEFHVELRDARGRPAASFVLDAREEKAELARPLAYFAQRYDANRALVTSSLEMQRTDALVEDHGPQLAELDGAYVVHLRVPCDALAIAASADGYGATAARTESGRDAQRLVLELVRDR